MYKRVLLGAVLILLMAGGLAAACSSDTADLEARIEALETGSGQQDRLDELHTQIQRASMVATLNLLDGVGFHELNITIDADGVAPSGTVGTIRSALRAVAATAWPDELQEGAASFQEKLSVFLTSLSNESADVVDTSLVAHDAYHDFTDKAWSHLAEDLGLAEGGTGHDVDGMDMGATPDGDMDIGATPANDMDMEATPAQ